MLTQQRRLSDLHRRVRQLERATDRLEGAPLRVRHIDDHLTHLQVRIVDNVRGIQDRTAWHINGIELLVDFKFRILHGPGFNQRIDLVEAFEPAAGVL